MTNGHYMIIAYLVFWYGIELPSNSESAKSYRQNGSSVVAYSTYNLPTISQRYELRIWCELQGQSIASY